jgi:hypothetical protein
MNVTTTKYNANPAADMTLTDVRRFAKQYQLEVGTHAPGDGVRRIQFLSGGHIIYTALGIREAETFLRGYMTGWDACESPRKSFQTNPPRIIHRDGRIKVYWDSNTEEYIVTDGTPSEDHGYHTSDKADAIDTARSMNMNQNPPLEFSDEDFGVFVWREDGRYNMADSVGNYRRKSAAEKFADKLNEKHPNTYVVRTLKYTRRP